MKKEIREIEKRMQADDLIAESVSQKGSYWHLHHLLRVITGIVYMMENSDPTEYKWKFNLARFYIFSIGKMPRGKGRAPKAVMATEAVSREDLEKLLPKAKAAWVKIPSLPKNAFFNHKYFGLLNRKASQRMILLHTRHHLKIIRDIEKAN